MFTPASAGPARDLAAAAIQGAAQIFPLLLAVAAPDGRAAPAAVPIASFASSDSKRRAAATLQKLLDRYGSDKASAAHDYHLLYSSLLCEPESVTALLEIGLGTNSRRVVSNMCGEGTPGASLRAFRDFLPNAQIYGADIDRRILFTEDRITTFFADQTDPASLAALVEKAPGPFDLIIDDGLHSPAANLAVLHFGLPELKPGGWLVIEDIRAEALPVWHLTAAILPQEFRATLVTARNASLFAVRRLGT